MQEFEAVRRDAHSRTDLAEFLGLLQDRHLVPVQREADACEEPADSSTDDNDMKKSFVVMRVMMFLDHLVNLSVFLGLKLWFLHAGDLGE